MFDNYGEVINSEEAYQTIAKDLMEEGSVAVGWSDGESTHLDLFFILKCRQYGPLSGGQRSSTDLFVGASRFGMFGFDMRAGEKHPSYVGEKLALGGQNDTTIALAKLINGIIDEIKSKDV